LPKLQTIDEKKDRDFWKKKAEKLEQKYVQNNEEWQKWALVLVERIKALVADLEKVF
jgi:hypothetical protein